MKFFILIGIFLMSLYFFYTPHQESGLSKTNFGALASHPDIKKLATQITPPPTLTDTHSARFTFNKMGIDTVGQNGIDADGWVLKEFVKYAGNIQKPLLDLGAGFCGASIQALGTGATVIANDLSMDHLLVGLQSIKNEALLERLYLNTQRFPQLTDFPEGSLGGVFAHRVFHFLSGEEIEMGLSKISKWLQTGSKLFIVVMAPQNQIYRDWVMPEYEKKWEEGNPWPGDYIEMKKAMPLFVDLTPKYLHVLDERPLKKALERHGFRIEKSLFIPRTYEKDGIKTVDPQAMYGVIAIKN